MTPPLWALVGWVAWTMLLVSAVVGTRGLEMLAGRKKSNEFPSGTPHGSERYWRLNRAHANSVENLVLVATLVMVGTLAHVESRAFTLLPVVALGARVGQSLAHIWSSSVMTVNVRFTFFLAQYICFAWMIVEIVRRFW
jgi:hypothetical protein